MTKIESKEPLLKWVESENPLMHFSRYHGYDITRHTQAGRENAYTYVVVSPNGRRTATTVWNTVKKIILSEDQLSLL